MTIRELFVYLGFDVDTSGAEKMEKSVENVKKRQESMVSSFIKGQMIYDAGKKVISAAFNFVKDSVIGAEAEVERYRVVLGTMIGDQEKANAIIHDLDWNSGLSDYYGTANAVGGLQSLVTYGLQAEEAADALKRIGDVAQGDSEAFNSMAQNLGQVFATGKASAMDLKQFANRGFDVVGELARIEGKSREEIEKAGVGYKEIKKALDSLTSAGGKYEGMLEKQKNTLGGVLKRIEAFKVGVAENIGHAINEPLKELLVTILEIADKGKEAFIDKFAGALKVVIHWIHQVVISFEIIKMRIEESGDKFNGLAKLIKSVFSVVGKVIEGFIPILTDIILLVLNVASTIGNFLAPVVRMVESIIMDVISQFDNWILAVENAIQFFQNAVNVIKSIWEGIKNFFNSLWEGLSAIFLTAISNISNNIINKFNALKNFLVDFWNALKSGPQAFVEFISNIFINMIENIKEKLFGFIDVAKNTIGKVKDFFGGAWDSAVNFVSGGKKEKSSSNLMDSAVGNTSTYYGNQSSNSVINAPTTMNISVPQGTSEEQQKAIAEQIKFAYNSQLAYAINSSRANIPSPEKRRY